MRVFYPHANRPKGELLTPKHFYDWQTEGGTDDVKRLVDSLEKADIAWCAIGGIAVNHWAQEPMVTRDVDIVVVTGMVERAVKILEQAGFTSEHFKWSVKLKGRSSVTIQISTERFYADFPARSAAADIHGMLMRVASLEDTLAGKIEAWKDDNRRQSKKIKDLADIARLVESHPQLWGKLGADLQGIIQRPGEGCQ